MTINNKSERNYRGKCLGSPVTTYSGVREVNLTGIDSNFTARETQDYAPLQSYKKPSKLSQFQNTQWTFNTYSDVPCHLKVAEINLRWLIVDGSVKENSLSVFRGNSSKYNNDQTEIDSSFTARLAQDYPPLQRQATNNQANSHNFKTLNGINLQWLSLPF